MTLIQRPVVRSPYLSGRMTCYSNDITMRLQESTMPYDNRWPVFPPLQRGELALLDMVWSISGPFSSIPLGEFCTTENGRYGSLCAVGEYEIIHLVQTRYMSPHWVALARSVVGPDLDPMLIR